MRYSLFLILLINSGCHPSHPSFAPAPGIPAVSRQVIVVTPVGAIPRVLVSAWERDGDVWRSVFVKLPGTVGHKGVALLDRKVEGDGCTPSGVFSLGPAFGYSPSLDTGLDYRPTSANDYWIDDPSSPDYNRWVVSATKPSCSHEVMRRSDDFYSAGAVIGYNTDRVVSGKGSAIFLHVWRGPNEPTTGCVALAADDVKKLLAWLDRKKSPVIAIQSTNVLHRLANESKE